MMHVMATDQTLWVAIQITAGPHTALHSSQSSCESSLLETILDDFLF